MKAEATQPEQIENSRLAAAIAQLAAKQNEENWRDFYKQLVESNLWLVVAKPVDGITEGEVPHQKGLEAGFVALRDDRGHVSVPAFTDVAALRKWAPPEHPWMLVPCLVLLRELAKNPAAHLDINRRCEGEWQLTHNEIVALSRCETPAIALSPEVLSDLVRSPQTSIKALSGNWPVELFSALRNVLAVLRPVVDAYAFELSAGTSQYAVIGLRFTDMPDLALFTETTYQLHALAKGNPAPDQVLQYMALNERDVLARVAESVEPFFARR
jgi:hypothetical protein